MDQVRSAGADILLGFPYLVFAIGLSFWVQYARTVRGSVMVEKNRDYVADAQLIGLPAPYATI